MYIHGIFDTIISLTYEMSITQHHDNKQLEIRQT
jgi:hypothetical protein